MRRTVWVLALILAVGIAVGLMGDRVLNAQQQPVKRTVLQKVDLGDKEGVMYLFEIAPGAATTKHYHPGTDFFYVMAGSIILEREGKSSVTYKAGDAGHQPLKQVHRVVNASTTDPVKGLGFLLAEKGQPFTVDVK